MKIAVISDSHDNFNNLVLFLKEVKKYNVQKILFLGDFGNNGIAKLLASYNVPVFAIWGNNDGDKVAITKTSLQDGSNLTVGFDTFDFLEIDGKKIFITHYPMLARPMAKSGEYDVVFYGHNHKKNIEIINSSLVVNPGEISGHKTGEATFAIYDTSSNTAKIITLENIITTNSEIVDRYRRELNFEFSKSKSHEY